jgi:glycosyltransferase involved in cell wall biosynthesis
MRDSDIGSVTGGRWKTMPASWYEAIPSIVSRVRRENPKTILDIGIGFGKYGMLLRESLDISLGRYERDSWAVRIDGVEAFPEYRNPIHDYAYDNVYYGAVPGVLNGLPSYDVVLLVDVLEHFTKEEGLDVIRELKSHSRKCLVISTPLHPSEQEAYLGNEYECHRSRWGPMDFAEHDFSYQVLPLGDNGAQIITIWPDHVPEHSYSQDDFVKAAAAVRNKSERRHLTISYVIPHTNLTGGLKMLLEQMKQLKSRGHRIVAVRKAPPEGPVLPDWYDVKVDKEVLVPAKDDITPYVQDSDVVMAGWMGQLPDLVRARPPVVYWEQGNEWLFGELTGRYDEMTYRQYLKHCYSQPCCLAAASATIADILNTRYGRKAMIVPNGVDLELFRPGKHRDPDTILLVGNPMLRFKGFQVALRALWRVWKAGFRFRVKWVCQNRPQIGGTEYPLEFIVKPSQDILAEIYRTSGLFLFTSWYEGFAMPPLEAMASGTPVVATDCGGIRAYARAGENALLGDPGDADSLAKGIAFLLSNPGACEALSAAGLSTAQDFTIGRAVDALEDCLFSATEHARSSDRRKAALT